MEYVHDSGTKGVMKLVGIDEEYSNFEWHFEWTHDKFFPLTDGEVKAIPIQSMDNDRIVSYETIHGLLRPDDPRIFEKGKPWMIYKNTSHRVGWRGPVILWDLLQYCPKVYFVNWVKQDQIDTNLQRILSSAF